MGKKNLVIWIPREYHDTEKVANLMNKDIRVFLDDQIWSKENEIEYEELFLRLTKNFRSLY